MAPEPSRVVVCNCGPLIALAGINQLALLPRLFDQVWVPVAVQRELTGSRRFAGTREVFGQPWLKVASPSEPVDPFLASQLDPGEAAVLTLARQFKNVEVLIDERKGRRVAERVYGLRILGTGGCLLRAKAAGLIAGVQPCLAAMKGNGYHLSSRLVRAICQAAGEPAGVSD
ncbi:MAG: DUF3368 domain-containing protein [Limisphaerales bacterium]